MGGIGFLANSRGLHDTRACAHTQVLPVPRDAMLALMAANPDMSDIIISVFAARCSGHLERGVAGLRASRRVSIPGPKDCAPV